MKAASVLIVSLFAAVPAWGASRGEVLEFTSQDCIYCRQMEPIVARLQREGLPVRQVRDPAAARQYGVSGLPTFLLLVDGQELQRMEGAVQESQLRTLVAKIPATTPEPADSRVTRVELGEPSDMPPAPRPRPGQGIAEPTEIKLVDASAGETSSLWPFRRKKQPQEFRGQSEEFTPPPVRSEESAHAASVRLRIVSGQSAISASGTIIRSQPGRTLVVTGGNLLGNAGPDAKFEVYIGDRPHLARVVNFDASGDVGLLEFGTDTPLTAAAVAPEAGAPAIGDRVVSFGATEGKELSREQVRVLAVNKYEGPDNIECSGTPTQGRCGGGLFNARGELVGICLASGDDGSTGIYAGLKVIQGLLRSCGEEALFASPQFLAAAGEPALTNVDLGSAQAAPAPAMMRSGADDLFAGFGSRNEAQTASAGGQVAQAEAALSGSGNGQELIVILPAKQTGSPRVMVIHRPSPKLLSFLNGESDPLHPDGATRSARTDARGGNSRDRSNTLQANAAR